MHLFDKEYSNISRINTLPFRSYYIPFALEDKPSYSFGIIDKKSSSRYFSLNGKWNIKEHESIDKINDISEELIDFIEVPSVVQLNGYDQIQYINDKYPFPFNPPIIPKKNPTYHYRKNFLFHKNDGYLYHINFEGVDSAFYLFVNGTKIGYSLISHSKSEFDITNQLVDGSNTIDVIVLKWNACSYLECQDKFRFTGIFRDVYILIRPDEYIFDYKITPIHEDGYYVKIDNLSTTSFNVSFLGNNYNVYSDSSCLIKIDNPVLWTSENPYLYKLNLYTDKEIIYHSFGFVISKIKNGIFVINDEHTKLKGVNRHEVHPLKGPAIDVEDIYKDLILIKSYNCNAIRTAHYPNIPEFYELCNLLGIYVLDEADIECHGAAYKEDKYDLEHWQKFANNGIFDLAILDREISLYERDKNFTCIVIFSLGNESSFGKMFYDGIKYFKSHDTRPLQYEGIANIDKNEEYYNCGVDIVSRMYPPYSYLEEFLEDDKENRPLLLCEYSHAMGNSCGDIKDYWDVIMTNERFIGGFVWEWCDHSLLVNGRLIYGGDSGEKIHNGNFCVDGLMSAFREPKSGALEMKGIYGNLYEKAHGENTIEKWPQCTKNKPLVLELNKTNGDIEKIIIDGKIINSKPIKIQFTRANIDNEQSDIETINRIRNAHVILTDYTNNTHYKALLIDSCGNDLLAFDVNFETFDNSFDITISYDVLVDIKLPRFGFELIMPKEGNGIVTYHGYGPEETYIDKHHWVDIGTYSFEVKNNYNHAYLKPQENGSHFGCTYFKTDTFMVISDNSFSFNALEYGLEELVSTKHDYELNRDDFYHFSIDLFMSGVGSHSCGPELKEEYCTPRKMTKKFKLLFNNF